MVPYLAEKQIVITQGFIGSNATGETTTLGKEGSDFTSAILAAVLGAQSLTIWKNVPGVMNVDPRLYKKATLLSHLSYKKMAEMAFYGAKVIHQNTIKPLATHNIPLYIKPFHDFHKTGTEISSKPAKIDLPIYILREDQELFQLSLDDLTFFDEACMEKIFSHLKQQNIHVTMLAKDAYMLAICVQAAPHKIRVLRTALDQTFQVQHQERVNLLTVMHQPDNLLQTLLHHKAILLTQQRSGICQVAFKHQENNTNKATESLLTFMKHK